MSAATHGHGTPTDNIKQQQLMSKTTTTIRLIAAAAVAAIMAACGNHQKGDGGNSGDSSRQTAVMSPFVRINIDSTMALVSIRDNATEKKMPNRLFYGKGDSAEVEKLSPEGSVPSSVSCFIIETQGKRALFDTGVGKANGGVLMDRLKSLGIKPESIDYIFITHFHNDHTGGLTDNGKVAFSRAQLYVPEAEYAYWAGAGGKGSTAIKAVGAYGNRLHRFGYGDKLPLGVKPMAAPGHTPGHTVYIAGRVMIMGDLFHGLPLQIQDLNLCADYDMDRTKAIESRNKYTLMAVHNGMMAAGMHFFGTGMVDFKMNERDMELKSFEHNLPKR